MKDVVTVAIFWALCVMPAAAQIPDADGPKFEVASVKKSALGGGGVLYHLPAGRFKAKKLTLLNLISFCYEIPEDQITGLPPWGTSDRFDIEAIADGPLELDPKKMETPTKKAMVRQLLAERFGLETRREEKNTAIYSLVVAPGGPKLERNVDKPFLAQAGKRSYTYQKVSMAYLAKHLTANLRRDIGRMVVDTTGMEGDFDFKLTWGPLKTVGTLPQADPAQPLPSVIADDLPDIVTAVQQQLGLKLQSDHAPEPFLIVVRATPPSAN
jgi:uncharacterized protein (TIGR03435 family)